MGIHLGRPSFTSACNSQSNQSLDDAWLFNVMLQRKVFPAAIQSCGTSRRREGHLHPVPLVPCLGLIQFPSKVHGLCPRSTSRDGYWLLKCFLLLTFQCCFYFTKTGIEPSLDYTQFTCKCQTGSSSRLVKIKVPLLWVPAQRKHRSGWSRQSDPIHRKMRVEASLWVPPKTSKQHSQTRITYRDVAVSLGNRITSSVKDLGKIF